MAYERKEIVGNAAATTLSAGISDSATSMTIADGTNWPDGSTGPFIIAISAGEATEEKILCESRTGNTITVRSADGRGHDDTTAQAHSTGATVQHVLDAETLDQANRYVNLQTTKGDIVVHNGVNPARVASGATDDSLDGYALQLDWSASTGLAFARLVTVLAQASAPAVAGYVRLWYDTDNKVLRASDGSSWPIPVQALSVADDTERDSLFSSVAAGHICWRQDLGFAEIYNGTAWEPLGRASFTNATARDAYFTSPADGDEAYLTASHELTLYRNDEWILVTREQSVSSSAPSSPQDGDLWLQPVT